MLKSRDKKLRDETFLPGTNKRHWAHLLINEELLETSNINTNQTRKNGQKGRKLAIHRKIQMADRPKGEKFRRDF